MFLLLVLKFLIFQTQKCVYMNFACSGDFEISKKCCVHNFDYSVHLFKRRYFNLLSILW